MSAPWRDGIDFAAAEIAHGLRELLEGLQSWPTMTRTPEQQEERRRRGAERIRTGLREAMTIIVTDGGGS